MIKYKSLHCQTFMFHCKGKSETTDCNNQTPNFCINIILLKTSEFEVQVNVLYCICSETYLYLSLITL